VLSIVNFIHTNLGCSVLVQIKPFVYLLNVFYVFIFIKKIHIFYPYIKSLFFFPVLGVLHHFMILWSHLSVFSFSQLDNTKLYKIL